MNKMIKRAALLAAAFIVSIPLGLMAQAQDEGYYPYSFARLSYVNGAVYVQRTSDLGYEKGEVNLALVQGDRIGTDAGQAEIHFGRRNYLRLGDNTKVEFALLPTEGQERIKLHLTEGSAYLRVSQLALDKGIEVHTPDASFYVLEEGLYRFDVALDRETQAFVREGSLEAAAEDGSVLVGYQETVTASDGRLLGDPQHGYSRNDAFDGWNDSRDQEFSTRAERTYLPTEMVEYEEELDENGHWVYERPYGNVWVPNVSYYDDWRPYYYGRWVWYPIIGWTWVSSEPWGWAVYHYGRWNWRFGLGWYWIPQRHWGPAWVHWWWDHHHVGWCPLTWHNRPAYLFNNRFYDRYDDHWFSARNRAMTVVRRDHLQAPDVGRRHLGVADLDRIGRVELRPQQPSIRPAVDNGRPQAIAARRVLADRSGHRVQVRSLAPSRSLVSPRSRTGGENPVVRGRDQDAPAVRIDRGSLARPSVRNDASGGRAIRSYPSRRDESGSAVAPSRRSGASGGDGGGRAVTRQEDRPSGSSAVRSGSVREPQRARTSGSDAGSSVTRRSEGVKSYPSTVRSGSTEKGRSGSSTSRTIRSAPDRPADSSAGRSQSRTYASRTQVSRPPARVSPPTVSSSSRPSSSARQSASSLSRSSAPRTPSSTRPRVSSSPSRSSSPSYSRPSASRPASSSRPRSSYTAPDRPGGSSGRSYAAPRSSGSSGRSLSAPRSGGSSGRSSGAVRSGGSSSSGRSASSSSKSSGSSGRSSGARRKG
jgi:hypothetical protein